MFALGRVRQGAYPRVEHLIGASFGSALTVLTYIRLGRKKASLYKTLKLIGPFASYEEKKLL